MVYQDLCIYAESVVEHILSGKDEPGQFAHRVDTEGFQPPDCAGAGLLEISQRLVISEEITEGLLIQFCNTHTILIGRSVFRCDVHCQLGEIKVGADAGRGRDACRI